MQYIQIKHQATGFCRLVRKSSVRETLEVLLQRQSLSLSDRTLNLVLMRDRFEDDRMERLAEVRAEETRRDASHTKTRKRLHAQTFDDWNKELDMPKNWKGPALPAGWRVLRTDETIQRGDRVGYDNRLTPSWRPTRRVGERARCRQDENSLLPRQVYIRGVEKPTFRPEDNDGCRGPHYTPATPSRPAAPKVNYEARTFSEVPLSIPRGYYTLQPTEQVCRGDKLWSPTAREWTQAQNWCHVTRRQAERLIYIRRFPEVTTNL